MATQQRTSVPLRSEQGRVGKKMRKPRNLTAEELKEWRERMAQIGDGRRRHYWGTL
jgi:hypothetical protein